ncbi:MAG: hypothetical protein AAF518_13625 [Spirochaetota bacterium]
MSQKIKAEDAFRLYLQESQDHEAAAIASIILEYLSFLYSAEEEPILLEDFSEYEVDDLLEFYLMDNYQDYEKIRGKMRVFLKGFVRFALAKSYLSKEEARDWKNVL